MIYHDICNYVYIKNIKSNKKDTFCYVKLADQFLFKLDFQKV